MHVVASGTQVVAVVRDDDADGGSFVGDPSVAFCHALDHFYGNPLVAKALAAGACSVWGVGGAPISRGMHGHWGASAAVCKHALAHRSFGASHLSAWHTSMMKELECSEAPGWDWMDVQA